MSLTQIRLIAGGIGLVVVGLALWWCCEYLIDMGREDGLKDGRAEVQGKWDKQKAADDKESKRLAKVAADEKERKDREQARLTADQAQLLDAERKRRVAAESANSGLRGTIAALNRDDLSAVAGNPAVAALVGRLATARDLVGRCADRYQGLADRAGILRAQVVGLQDFVANVCHAPGDTAPVPQPVPTE